MPPLQDVFPDATPAAKDALRFYEENYTSIGQWIIEPEKKTVLRSSQPGVCRFCGLGVPIVIFKDEAHAIPRSLGNTSLTTKYECDACNHFFGNGIENDFGNWSKPMRTICRIRGRKGVPTLQKTPYGGWRIEHGPAGLAVTQYEEEPIAVVNEAANKIDLTLRRDPYTPVAVLKAFTKMGLTLLPESELPNFRDAMAWICSADHHASALNVLPVLHTYVPGDNPYGNIAAILLRRNRDDLPLPYASFVLTYGNEVFQTFLPSPLRNAGIVGRRIKFRYFPNPYALGVEAEAPMRRETIDLTGRSLVTGDTIQTTIPFLRSTGDGPT